MVRYTYEESVRWLRSQPEYSETVLQSYLDEDNLAAAKRFAASEEFREVVKILRLDKSSKKLKILDIGCGNGISSYAFACLGHDVFAVDPDPSEDVGLGAVQKLASKVHNGSLKTFQAVSESLPFPDSTFNIIYARQSLHHFSDLGKGLAECSRVLKPKSFLLATREHVVSDEKELQTFLDNHILHKLHGGENAYPLEDYISKFKESGFKVLKYFAPFDTVINHFPVSNDDLKNWLFKSIERKLGRVAASILIKIYYTEMLYRHWLSSSWEAPGRVYSFLCVKGKGS
ncbi:MAG: class I SAM-dependent methyltransferase [Phormidium sp.]